MAEGGNQASGVGLRKVGVTEGGRAVVLDAVDTTEVVLAVRTDRGARLGVLRATGVIVGHDGSIEVDDVHGAIRTEGDVNRTEPMIGRAKPFGVRQKQLTLEGGAIEDELLVVDDVENRFADEDRAIVFLGPGTVLIDRRCTGGGVATDLVDLQQRGAIREVLTGNWTTGIHRSEGLGGRARNLRENGLRQHDVLNRITGRRLAMEELHVTGDFVTETITARRGDLLNRGTVGLKAERARGKARHRRTRLSMRGDTTTAIGGVDPTVGGNDEVVGDEVGVSGGETAEEDLFLVGLAVTIRIAQPDDVLLGDDNHAVFIDTETGDQFEAFVEDDLLVEDTVFLRGN